jgi:heat shock protein HtpX
MNYHIRNRDVRVLIISIIFRWHICFFAEVAFRSLRFAGEAKKDSKGGGVIILVANCGYRSCLFDLYVPSFWY